MPIIVKFEGVDSFHRPVFKDTESNARYGDTDNLFPYSATEMEVIEKVSSRDLIFFGNKFDCEPHGGFPPRILRIVV